MKTRFILILAAFLLSLSGCSTISSRIGERERTFNTYPPETQAQIQSGNIDKGFTEDMVYMAKGEPSEKSTSTREENGRRKTITLWKYKRPSLVEPPAGQVSSNLSSPYGYPSFGPGPNQPSGTMLYNRAYDTIEFENGKVTGWR